MEKREYRRNAIVIIYLTACAVNGTVPDTEKLRDYDLGQLFEVCQDHILTACAAYALESAGIQDAQFMQAKEKAIRKNILLDAERRKIFVRLEQEQIWYMPLKGAILKDWYPKLGMRQMSDNDILYDFSRRRDVQQIMSEFGFRLSAAREVVDEYLKEPVYNFEMHGELFMKYQVGEMADYYRGVKDKMLKDAQNAYGYHFSSEEFYLFMLAHEYKHFKLSGTGIRSLLDTYIFLREFSDTLDWNYIQAECEKLGIAEYEENNRVLAMKLFARQKLTEEEKQLLNYHIFSGTYGNQETELENRFRQHGSGSRLRYVLYRFFPPYESLKTSVPWVATSDLLIPAAWAFRLIKAPFTSGKKLMNEVRFLKNK
ncbi:MAG: nucleotidyltransferase family protein [Oscillospiraceae bacterium]|nr:nucleotidyltransferase family protein [Oscillospiraceae bacterium]